MTIQVFNLSLNITDTDLTRLFAAYGVVHSAEVSRNKYTGRSKGNGLIQMPVDTEAAKAIATLDQSMLDGKKISVSEFQLPPHW